MAKLTKKDVKAAAAKAAKKAREKGARIAAAAGEKARAARDGLNTMKHRRVVDAAEVVGGGALSGFLAANDIKIGNAKPTDGSDPTMEIPGGLVGGVVLAGAGVFMKSYDMQALGLGMVAHGGGKLVEDQLREMYADQKAQEAAA